MAHVDIEYALQRAASALAKADAVVVHTGAGMGVGSGLGTFRGPNAGVWPGCAKFNIDFVEMSNPRWFKKDPHFGWSFWHFRHTAYTGNKPHAGYHFLKRLMDSKPQFGGFSVTSNIDGHWVDTGVSHDRLYEVHGSLRFLQCVENCTSDGTEGDAFDDENLEKGIWKIDSEVIKKFEIDPETFKVHPHCELPKCIYCGKLARPNVLMFGDWGYRGERQERQSAHHYKWLKSVQDAKANLVVIEIGAGKAVPTIREMSKQAINSYGATLIRINPVDYGISSNEPKHISIPMNGEEALLKLEELSKSEKL